MGFSRLRSRGTAVVLGCEQRLFFPLSLGNDLLQCLVATLGGLPVRAAKGLVDFVHVQLVEKGHVVGLVRGCGDGRHGWEGRKARRAGLRRRMGGRGRRGEKRRESGVEEVGGGDGRVGRVRRVKRVGAVYS